MAAKCKEAQKNTLLMMCCNAFFFSSDTVKEEEEVLDALSVDMIMYPSYKNPIAITST